MSISGWKKKRRPPTKFIWQFAVSLSLSCVRSGLIRKIYEQFFVSDGTEDGKLTDEQTVTANQKNDCKMKNIPKSGSILRFKLHFDLGYGYCKLIGCAICEKTL